MKKSLALYVLGTMSTVVLPHLFGWDMRRVCPLIDALFADLEERDPDHFAVKQYRKYKLAAGDICSK